ncbi:hypothetical protein ACFCW6_09560 [Streptomyces sp. NPDC056333]|uniref:hypothetical protein n=1 Tax=Streptomyces sp. NPDC056333 TaxID=3345786 RepID=UPI0035E29576
MGPKDSVTGGHPPGCGVHSAAEAASWALTGPVGRELAPHGIAVSTLRVGLMDMAGDVPAGQKTGPVPMARRGLQHGLLEVLADDVSGQGERIPATRSAAA